MWPYPHGSAVDFLKNLFSKGTRMEQQIQHNLNQKNRASWRQFALLTVGAESLWALLKHEIITGLLGGFPGALGFWLRRKIYPSLFAACGRGLIVGRHVTLRGTQKIHIGDNVALDDQTVLDARGEEARIEIGDRALISRNSIVRARNGLIRIGPRADIGANCILATDSRLEIGGDALIAAYCYLIAGGNHRFDRTDVPINQQGFQSRGGIVLEDDVWLGAHSAVQDGVRIGRGAIIGTHSMVNKSLDPLVIAWGVPAVKQRSRDASA